MFKKATLFAFILLAAILAKADGFIQNQFLSAAPGSSINLIGTGIAFHQITWNVSGTVSGCSVQLDSSADGITWSLANAIAAQTCTSNGNTVLFSGVFNYVRVNVTTLTGTGSVNVTWNGYVVNSPAAPPVPSLPVNCSQGQLAFLTTGTTGLYQCNPANTWVLNSTGSSSGSGNVGAMAVWSATSSLTSSANFLDCGALIANGTYTDFSACITAVSNAATVGTTVICFNPTVCNNTYTAEAEQGEPANGTHAKVPVTVLLGNGIYPRCNVQNHNNRCWSMWEATETYCLGGQPTSSNFKGSGLVVASTAIVREVWSNGDHGGGQNMARVHGCNMFVESGATIDVAAWRITGGSGGYVWENLDYREGAATALIPFLLDNSGANNTVSACGSWPCIVSGSSASNVCTLTMQANAAAWMQENMWFGIGQQITTAGFTPSGYNAGPIVPTFLSNTTFSYACSAGNAAATVVGNYTINALPGSTAFPGLTGTSRFTDENIIATHGANQVPCAIVRAPFTASGSQITDQVFSGNCQGGGTTSNAHFYVEGQGSNNSNSIRDLSVPYLHTECQAGALSVDGARYHDVSRMTIFHHTVGVCTSGNTDHVLAETTGGMTNTLKFIQTEAANGLIAYQNDIAGANPATVTNTRVGGVDMIPDEIDYPGLSTGAQRATAGIRYVGVERIGTEFQIGSTLMVDNAAPTINTASDFNTGTCTTCNNTAAFKVTIGIGTANSTGTIKFANAATTGWVCQADNLTRADLIQQTGGTTTTAVFTNYATTIGTPVNWTNSDVIQFQCSAY